LTEALFTVQILERICGMWLLTNAVGTPIPIPAVHVDSERDRWLNKYGTTADGVVAGTRRQS
jgi:hypothetical protein